MNEQPTQEGIDAVLKLIDASEPITTEAERVYASEAFKALVEMAKRESAYSEVRVQ